MSKLSEIVLTAILSGIVAAVTVVAAYLLGKRQSDKNWKIELAQREKEQEEKEKNEIYIRRMDMLNIIIEQSSKIFISVIKLDDNSIYVTSDFYSRGVEFMWEIDKALPLFPDSITPSLNKSLSEIRAHTFSMIDDIVKAQSYQGTTILESEENKYEKFSIYHSILQNSLSIIHGNIEKMVNEFGQI